MPQNDGFGETYEVKVTADLTTFLNGLNNAVKSVNKFNSTFQQNINGLNQSIIVLNSNLTEFNKKMTEVSQKTNQASRSIKKDTKTTFGSLIHQVTVTIAFFGKLAGVLTLGALMWTWYRDGTLKTIFTIGTMSRTLGELTGAFAGVAAVLGQVLPGEMGKAFRGLNFMFNMLVSVIKNVTKWKHVSQDATRGTNRAHRKLIDVFKDVHKKYADMWENIVGRKGMEGPTKVTNIFNRLAQTIKWNAKEATRAANIAVLAGVKASRARVDAAKEAAKKIIPKKLRGQIELPGFETMEIRSPKNLKNIFAEWFSGLRSIFTAQFNKIMPKTFGQLSLDLTGMVKNAFFISPIKYIAVWGKTFFKGLVFGITRPLQEALDEVYKEFDEGIRRFGGPTAEADAAAALKRYGQPFILDPEIKAAEQAAWKQKHLADAKARAIENRRKKRAVVKQDIIDEIKDVAGDIDDGDDTLRRIIDTDYTKTFRNTFNNLFQSVKTHILSFWKKIISVLNTPPGEGIGQLDLFEKSFVDTYTEVFRRGLTNAYQKINISLTSFWANIIKILGAKREIIQLDLFEAQLVDSYTSTFRKGLDKIVLNASQSIKSFWGRIMQLSSSGSRVVGRDAAEQLVFSFEEKSTFSKLFSIISLSFTALLLKIKGLGFFTSLKKFYNTNFASVADEAAASFTAGFAKGFKEKIPGAEAWIKTFKDFKSKFASTEGLEGVPNIFKGLGATGVVLTAVLELLLFKTGQIISALGTGFIQAGAAGIKTLSHMAELSAYAASAMASLTAAVAVYAKTTGDSTKGVKYWTQFLKEMADATGASRLELMKSGGAIIDMAASLGASQAEIEKFTKGVIAVARLQGRTIYEVARTVRGAIAGNATSLIILGASLEDVGMSYEGLTSELSNLDSKLTGTALKQARFKKIMEVLGPSIDQAAILTNHFAAAVARLQGAWTNLVADIGRGAENFLTKILDSITAIIDAMDELPDSIKRFMGTAATVASFGVILGGIALKIGGLAIELGVLTVLFVTLDQVVKAFTRRTLVSLVASVAKAATGVEVLNFSSIGASIKTISQMIYGMFGPSLGYITVALNALKITLLGVGKAILKSIPYLILFEILIKVFAEVEAKTKIFSKLMHALVNIFGMIAISIGQVINILEWFTSDIAKAIAAMAMFAASPIVKVIDKLNASLKNSNKEMKSSSWMWLKLIVLSLGFKRILYALVSLIPGIGPVLRVILTLALSIYALFIDWGKIVDSLKEKFKSLGSNAKKVFATPLWRSGDINKQMHEYFVEMHKAREKEEKEYLDNIAKSGFMGKVAAALMATPSSLGKLFTLSIQSLFGTAGEEEKDTLIKSLKSSIEQINKEMQKVVTDIGGKATPDADPRVQFLKRKVSEIQGLENQLAQIELRSPRITPKDTADMEKTKEWTKLIQMYVDILKDAENINLMDISKLPSKLIDPAKKLMDLRILMGKLTLNELNGSIIKADASLTKMVDTLTKALSTTFPSGGAISKLVSTAQKENANRDIGYIMDLISRAQNTSIEPEVVIETADAKKELESLFKAAGVYKGDFENEVRTFNKTLTDVIGMNFDDIVKKIKDQKDEVENLRKVYKDTADNLYEYHLAHLNGFKAEKSAINDVIIAYERLGSVGDQKISFSDVIEQLVEVSKISKDISTGKGVQKQIGDIKKLAPAVQEWLKFQETVRGIVVQLDEAKSASLEAGHALLEHGTIQEKIIKLYAEAVKVVDTYNKSIDKASKIDFADSLAHYKKMLDEVAAKISSMKPEDAAAIGLIQYRDNIEQIIKALELVGDMQITLPDMSKGIKDYKTYKDYLIQLQNALVTLNLAKGIVGRNEGAKKAVDEAIKGISTIISNISGADKIILEEQRVNLEMYGGTYEQFYQNKLDVLDRYLREELKLNDKAIEDLKKTPWYKEQLIIMQAELKKSLRDRNRAVTEAQQDLDPILEKAEADEYERAQRRRKLAAQQSLDRSIILAEEKEFYRSQNQQLLDAQAAVDSSTGLASLVSGFKYAYKTIINETRSASEDVRDMWRSIFDNLQSTFSDFGKALVYGNRDALKQLKSQRDEDLASTQERYDEDRQRLDDDLANGKTTYSQYYEELRDLDKNYHKDISDAQRKFEQDMKNSLTTIQSLWEKFWRAMVDAAIEMLAQQAIKGIFTGITSMFSGVGAKGTLETGTAPGNPDVGHKGGFINDIVSGTAHSGGLINNLLSSIKKFHDGGLNANEVLIKALKSEYILNPKAVNSIGVEKLNYMNKTGEIPDQSKQPINIYNVTDMSSLPTLGPDDVVNIISYDIARRGQTYKTLTVMR